MSPLDARAASPAELAPEDVPDDAIAGRIAAAITEIAALYPDRPSLEALAEKAGLSPAHFQKQFRARVGVSPKRFLQHLTLAHAQTLLAEGESVLGAAIETGLSSTGRLHDLFVATVAMTPGEYRALGRDLEIRYGVAASPFGPVVLALTARGLAWLGFAGVTGIDDALAELRADWGLATLVRDDEAAAVTARRLFDPLGAGGEAPLPVLLRGTNFQLQVWRALLAIPEGHVVSYGAVARGLGRPSSARAVGAAVGANLISLVIPCHRVIRETGAIHAYRWGLPVKRALVAWERARMGA